MGRKKKAKKPPYKIRDYYYKGRPTPFIEEIIKYFLAPFARNVHMRNLTDDVLLSLFFHAEDRAVPYAQVVEQFTLPGDRYIAGGRTEEGSGKRRLFPGDFVIICFDSKLDYVKIEIEKTGDVYQLSKPQFKAITDKLRIL